MRDIGVDLRLVGLFTLAQAPWTFKMLWSPFMDRYRLPWLDRRRGWIALTQLCLCLCVLLLAGAGDEPDTPWVVFALALAIAFAGASQDIVLDAYAVDVLRPEEQGVAVGARIAVYRAAMYVAGGLSITFAASWSWPLVNAMLAASFLPLAIVTVLAPEPEEKAPEPRTLRDAVWLPFLGLLARHRALEILAFVVCYKLADNLAGALVRPFLHDMGYDAVDRGAAIATVGLAATLSGTFLGGALSTFLGLGHALWIFGFLQIFSNLGYVWVSLSPVDRVLMYSAVAFESLTSGMGTGAFSVLLLRITQRRFSATQYALFSSLFALPRLAAGPLAGYIVHALGWTVFFWISIVAGVPGMLLLGRFVPLGTREPSFPVELPRRRQPLRAFDLAALAAVGALAGGALGAAVAATLAGFEASGGGFDLWAGWQALVEPRGVEEWIRTFGVVVFALFSGLFTAAAVAAKRGAGAEGA